MKKTARTDEPESAGARAGKPVDEAVHKAVDKAVHKDEEVRKALEQTAPEEAHPVHVRRARSRFWLVIWAAAFLAVGGLYLLDRENVVRLPGLSFGRLHRALFAAMLVAGILFLERAFEHFAIRRFGNPVVRYNAKRVVRLVAAVLLLGIVGTILFANLYTGLVSLGVISLVVGLAVQSSMTSFIGWLYILIRAPYRVGDRIQIGEATGDVIDVSYLDTTLWEFGGKYVSSDHPSGRIIRFPNSKVLSTAVYNYSWPLFPYIWNEIRLPVAYDSDLEFVSKTMIEVADEQIGDEMRERVKVFSELLAKTPVDELTVQDKPVVLFRPSENTWLEAIVRYLVDPRRAGRVKTRLLKELLTRLNVEPERAKLPRGDAR
ncbi:MAG: mechanosensitive ion channel family protein [Acidobacteriota bacterium]